MTKDEQQRISLMLAFQAVITRGENAQSGAAVQKIIGLAKLMNEFCDLHLPQTFPEQLFAHLDDKEAAKLDADINMYGEELQKQGSVALPDDRKTLIELYDRLQNRKTHYLQWAFYARASKEEVSEAVLRLLKEVSELHMGVAP